MDRDGQRPLPLQEESLSNIALKTIETMNEIIDDIVYMNVPDDTTFMAYLFEVIDLFVKEGRSLYTGIVFAMISIVIMVLDFLQI